MKRFATGAGRSTPSTAISGGLQIATIATESGRWNSPTYRSCRIRRNALNVDGAVVISSTTSSPLVAAARRFAQESVEYTTSSSFSIGRPMKSTASRDPALIVSTW